MSGTKRNKQTKLPSYKLRRLIEKWAGQIVRYKTAGDLLQARQCQDAIDAANAILERRGQTTDRVAPN